MDLSIITVPWNSEKLIGEQIESVQKGCKNISFEEIVVDNASKDKTTELVEKEFGAIVIPTEAEGSLKVGERDFSTTLRSGRNDNPVKLIKNTENKGFGFANNQGASVAQGDYLLMLNPDMRVEEGSLDKMVAWMRAHKDVGLASCKLVDENGKLNEDAQPRRFPGWFDQMALLLKIPHIFPAVLNRYMFKGFDADQEQEVDSVRGSFMIIPRAVYEKLGWVFDPRYFIWFEDVDTCKEVKKMGLKVVHTPIITCVDYIGQSFKQRTTLWKQQQFTKSMLQYFQKWEPWYVFLPIMILRPVGIGLAWINDYISEINQKSKIKNQK